MTLLAVVLTTLTLKAMPYEMAREEAMYLTDKMAYELNLNQRQYEYAYEINLDYLMSLNRAEDAYGPYLYYRNEDLRHILYDWQWSLLGTLDYFLRPVAWRYGRWYYPVYTYYARNYYFYSRPSVYHNYRGGHGRNFHDRGYYTTLRPRWDGGFRGNDRGHVGRGGGQPGQQPNFGGRGQQGGQQQPNFGSRGQQGGQQQPSFGGRGQQGGQQQPNFGGRGQQGGQQQPNLGSRGQQGEQQQPNFGGRGQQGGQQLPSFGGRGQQGGQQQPNFGGRGQQGGQQPSMGTRTQPTQPSMGNRTQTTMGGNRGGATMGGATRSNGGGNMGGGASAGRGHR